MILEITRPTHATRPFCAPRPAFTAVPFWLRWYDQCHEIISTSADYALPILPVGTQTQPVGALLIDEQQSRGSAVYELRRLSGLTWDELAEMLGVTRQAANDWANGKPMKPVNAQKLRALLEGFHALPRMGAAEVRAALLAPLPAGGRAIDMLRAGAIEAGLAAVVSYLAGARIPLPAREGHRQHPAAYLDRLADRPIPATGPPAAQRTRRARASSRGG